MVVYCRLSIYHGWIYCNIQHNTKGQNCSDNELTQNTPDSKVHGANMGPIRGRQDPGGPHVGPMNFAIWDPYLAITGKLWVVFYELFWVLT